MTVVALYWTMPVEKSRHRSLTRRSRHMYSSSIHRDDPSERADPAEHAIRNMHDVFSSWHRRAILYCLQERDDPATVTAVCRQLVAWREGGEVPDPEEECVDRMRSRILQAHVSEMESFGILGRDPDDDTVWIPEDVTISVTHP